MTFSLTSYTMTISLINNKIAKGGCQNENQCYNTLRRVFCSRQAIPRWRNRQRGWLLTTRFEVRVLVEEPDAPKQLVSMWRRLLLFCGIGTSRGTDLATCGAFSHQRIDIRLGSEYHNLRRHYPRYAPIAGNCDLERAITTQCAAEPSEDVLDIRRRKAPLLIAKSAPL